jgi:hypothetical protein
LARVPPEEPELELVPPLLDEAPGPLDDPLVPPVPLELEAPEEPEALEALEPVLEDAVGVEADDPPEVELEEEVEAGLPQASRDASTSAGQLRMDIPSGEGPILPAGWK